MVENNYVWLYDEKGYQPVNPMFLSTIERCVNDPYRTLAWLVRRSGGYLKVDMNYQEMMWTNFFRANIPFNTSKLFASPNSWTWY